MGGMTAPVRDAGLQPQRTRLAWRRTTLSGTVTAVLAIRASVRASSPLTGAVLVLLCCVCWLGFLALAHLRIRTLAASPVPPTLTPRLAWAATGCAVALAVCAAVLVT
ncbi:DUF202 domain-containing protein [Streptomyces sp. SID2999]|uniref:DUF202 domain-containing protein n=1 Tax=Streptomyces sp. SID2999 TaxID=2690258 RepID=UPI001370F88D|nr:DUF202 domain-containing protein [Streptomyces sp. SID2999]MYZ08554.1 DUF202 domain-containing protein [Streptomyces sp. SID2999]